jgi:hypothetical protein
MRRPSPARQYHQNIQYRNGEDVNAGIFGDPQHRPQYRVWEHIGAHTGYVVDLVTTVTEISNKK